MSYEYSKGDRLIEPSSYMYSQFNGIDFINDFFSSRYKDMSNWAFGSLTVASDNARDLAKALLQQCGTPASCVPEKLSIENQIETAPMLNTIILDLSVGKVCMAETWLPLLIQRFEVTKKIYQTYEPGFRKGSGSYANIDNYISFGSILGILLQDRGNLQYLNAFLKVNDLLLSLTPSRFYAAEHKEAIPIMVSLERHYIQALMNESGVVTCEK